MFELENIVSMVREEFVLQVGFIIAFIMVILAIKDIFSFRNRGGKPHEDYKSSIISLGIFGTFFGIIAGLWSFDTSNIEGSVPPLLDGLKTAFLTSFFGMGLTTLIGILQRKGESKREKSETDSLFHYIYQINENMIVNGEKTSDRIKSLSDENKEIISILKEIRDSIEKGNSDLRETLDEKFEILEKFDGQDVFEEEILQKKESFDEVLEKEIEKKSFEPKKFDMPEELEEIAQKDYIQPSMVKVSRGNFMMGSDDGRDFEKPLHKVNINYNFYVGKYQVTFDEYDKFCEDVGKKRPNDKGWGRGKRPVINISWSDAKEYAQWLSKKTGKEYSLLSEAEWEYMAKAGTTTKWSFGDSADKLSEYGWYNSNSDKKTHPVGEKRPNRWDIYDVHGNVWEWCEDDWIEDYSSTPTDGSPYIDESSNKKVVRGGSWFNFLDYTRSVNRSSSDKSNREYYYGFRLKVSI